MQTRIYELENVNVDIRENHARALRAEQVGTAREANPTGQLSLFDRLEQALGILLITAGEHLAPRHAPHQSSVTNPAVH